MAVQKFLVGKLVASQCWLVVAGSVVEAVETDGALSKLVLGGCRPRTQHIWIWIWNGRVAPEIITSYHLEAVREGFDGLLPPIVGGAAPHEIVPRLGQPLRERGPCHSSRDLRFMGWLFGHEFSGTVIVHEVHGRGPVSRHILSNATAGAF